MMTREDQGASKDGVPIAYSDFLAEPVAEGFFDYYFKVGSELNENDWSNLFKLKLVICGESDVFRTVSDDVPLSINFINNGDSQVSHLTQN